MNIRSYALVLLFLGGCAVEVPRQMALSNPHNRHTVDNPGTDVNAIRKACAETMLNASPAEAATNIDAKALSGGSVVTVTVDATLLGQFGRDITYECVYTDGRLTSGRWTRGLK